MIYIFVFSISALFLWIAENRRFKNIGSTICVLLAIILPSLLAGMRDYSIGGDISAYGNHWFEAATTSSNYIDFIVNAKSYQIGYGYSTLNYIVSRFTDNPHWFYFILCLFEMVLLVVALYPYRNRMSMTFGFLMYFFLYYNDSLNNMRQFPAILIVLTAFRFIYNRELIKYILCVLLAITFHPTAFIAFSFYPIFIISRKKINKETSLFVFIATILCAMNIRKIFYFMYERNPNLLSRYVHYFANQDVIGGRYIRIILYIIFFVTFSVSKEKIYKMLPSEYDYSVWYMFSLISLLFTLTMFGTSSSYIIRLAYYFDFFALIYVPSLLYSNQRPKRKYTTNSKYLFYFFTIFIYWLITYVVRNGAGTVPYVFMKS